MKPLKYNYIVILFCFYCVSNNTMAKNNNTQFYTGDTVNLAMAKLTTLHSTTKWLYFKDSTNIDAVTIFENYKDAFGLNINGVAKFK